MSLLTRLDVVLYIAGFLLSFAMATMLTPLVGRWATARGMVAQPRQDRWHKKPTPLLGGVAIYAGATTVILAFSQLDSRVLGLVIGGAVLFVTGLVDDRYRLKPHHKLVIQILAACILIAGGVQLETSNLAIISIPLTIVWVVGLTNAFNLLDNMDGLSAGTATVASCFLFALSLSLGNAGLGLLCLAVAGASLGFLIFNFNPARIFMGDSGSMFLGFTLSGIALLGAREMASDVFFVLLVPAAMMGLPIFDTTLVTLVRTVEGRPLSQGGRDHLSHRLVALGLSERQAVLVLYMLAAAFGVVGLAARSLGVWESMALAGALVTGVVIFGAYLAQVRLYSPREFIRAEQSAQLDDRPVVNGMIMFKRELGMAGFDFLLICVSFLGAFILRFGTPGNAPPPVGDPTWPTTFSDTVAFVVVVKLAVLVYLRTYRGMLRYVDVTDVMRLLRTSVVATVICAIAAVLVELAIPRIVVPKSVLVIDWLLFTMLLVGSRFSFAYLNDFFARLQARPQPRVLIVGAADLGELVLRCVMRSRPAHYLPVGFVDPDPGLWNRTIHGFRVLGGLTDLEDTLTQLDVDVVVVALPPSQRGVTGNLAARCEALDVECYTAPEFVEMHFAHPGIPEPVSESGAVEAAQSVIESGPIL